MIVYEESKVVNCDCRGGVVCPQKGGWRDLRMIGPHARASGILCVWQGNTWIPREGVMSVFDLRLPEYFFKVFWLLRGYC